MKNFDGCSYNELTQCIHARISWIRELRRFRLDELSKDYPYLRTSLIFKIGSYETEIRRLLEMRRILKDSGFKNWDSERFGNILIKLK